MCNLVCKQLEQLAIAVWQISIVPLTAYIYYLRVSVGQESGCGFFVSLLWICHEAVIKIPARAVVTPNLSRGRSPSRLTWYCRPQVIHTKLTCVAVDWLPILAGCWPKTLVPYYWGLSIGELTAWQLASPGASKGSKEEKARDGSLSLSLGSNHWSDIPSHVPYSIH